MNQPHKDGGPNDEERGQARIPSRRPSARSPSSVSFSFVE